MRRGRPSAGDTGRMRSACGLPPRRWRNGWRSIWDCSACRGRLHLALTGTVLRDKFTVHPFSIGIMGDPVPQRQERPFTAVRRFLQERQVEMAGNHYVAPLVETGGGELSQHGQVVPPRSCVPGDSVCWHGPSGRRRLRHPGRAGMIGTSAPLRGLCISETEQAIPDISAVYLVAMAEVDPLPVEIDDCRSPVYRWL